MKKEQFIKNLRYSLRKLKKDEREKYLAYYEEIISDMIENGVSEEEAVAHQGETKKSQKKFCGKMQLKRVQNWLDRFCFNYFDPFIGNSVRISDVSGISYKVGICRNPYRDRQ